MVLMEKALSMERQKVTGKTFSPYDELNTLNEATDIFTAIKSKIADTHLTEKLSTQVHNMINWSVEVAPRLGNQVSIAIGKTSIKQPQLLGVFEVKETQLYEMEPFAGPEKHYDLGIDLYDIESSWKD
ncbi:MAG: hypothetical protein NWE89_01080 [Candidatus Bathyarchaeota archaeon]|nr:hypothetical protein [Candidatus Bathyarchaeota archaeon]